MPGKRRQSSREFKHGAVRLAAESGRPLTHIARAQHPGRANAPVADAVAGIPGWRDGDESAAGSVTRR